MWVKNFSFIFQGISSVSIKKKKHLRCDKILSLSLKAYVAFSFFIQHVASISLSTMNTLNPTISCSTQKAANKSRIHHWFWNGTPEIACNTFFKRCYLIRVQTLNTRSTILTHLCIQYVIADYRDNTHQISRAHSSCLTNYINVDISLLFISR